LQAFHLPTAVALGHCSFEAYNAPSNIHGLKEVDLHGTETVYMDREFMEEVITGVLALHVHSAALMHLPDVDGRGKPSVSMRLGPSAGQPHLTYSFFLPCLAGLASFPAGHPWALGKESLAIWKTMTWY
jgi:hypothetical protein